MSKKTSFKGTEEILIWNATSGLWSWYFGVGHLHTGFPILLPVSPCKSITAEKCNPKMLIDTLNLDQRWPFSRRQWSRGGARGPIRIGPLAWTRPSSGGEVQVSSPCVHTSCILLSLVFDALKLSETPKWHWSRLTCAFYLFREEEFDDYFEDMFLWICWNQEAILLWLQFSFFFNSNVYCASLKPPCL